MLVLTRKPEEQIIIGNEELGSEKIVITVLKVQGGKVSVGIQADRKWQIVRKELLEEDARQCCEESGHPCSKGEMDVPFSSPSCAVSSTVEAMELAGAPVA